MKKAKIILNEDEIRVYTCTDETNGYHFSSSFPRKLPDILKWLFLKIEELKYLGYSIEFEINDNVEIPEIN